MNHFTKEELQYMLEMIDSIRIVNRSINEDQLQEKLQGMVDNYCEHKNIVENVGKVNVCASCGQIGFYL